MSFVTNSSRRPGERVQAVFQSSPALLQGFRLANDHAVNTCETGIRGTMLWGPVKPGPARLGQCDEEPFRAAFRVFDSEHEVARFESDGQGEFVVLLAAGVYSIVPDESTPVPHPWSQTKTVTVPEDGFAVVTLSFDTGLR